MEIALLVRMFCLRSINYNISVIVEVQEWFESCVIRNYANPITDLKIMINENQRGFLFKNGKYVKMLTAGKYYAFCGKEIDGEMSFSGEKTNNCPPLRR